jgi:pyridoxal phosphate enzyme (YggS family)
MTIAANLAAIQERIKKAALASGREAGAVRLIAVGKGQNEAALREALAAGHRLFGENRVQEAKAKYAPPRALYPGIELHLIGPLQTNKAEEAVRLFDTIETIDRPNLAEAVAKAIAKTGRKPRLSIEVNIASEPQKAGIAPGKLGDFLAFCRDTCRLSITGLMCIPPQAEDPSPHFTRLKELADRYRLAHISMGMSADFEAAIRCGATEVRVGTAIFGERAKLQ